MKRLPRFVFIMAATVGLGSSAACADPACVTVMVLENDSATNQSYEISIDGERVGTLSPGERSSFDVTSGSHTAQFDLMSGEPACGPLTKMWRECQTVGFICGL